jgi:hypothetical protein
MVNQAPYVVNLALDYEGTDNGWDARLLYNVVGKRISQVGTGGLDDIYAQPQHIVDVTLSKKIAKHFQIKGIAANLLDSRIRETVGRKNRDTQVTFQSYEGRVFTLQAAYTY